MLDEKIQLKIDLLQDQIDNLEKSGFFTENEINTRSIPLKARLALFKEVKYLYELSASTRLTADRMLSCARSFDKLGSIISDNFGISKESYDEGKQLHDMYFAPIRALQIEVIDAQILTPNHQEV